ncbi:hypothetical protein DPMN_181661 [Dreissena polymorpha]|uniref:Uncharacterized protein n=1 Tax=Dreissena polymorpha TaxID=45954 RepID=A0A9D4DEH2_DREPO|nr:hypothetical protein DPMN_181661 [Dreissena polymorpha]
MEDVYKGHKWDFSEWQSRLATKTSHPDDNSEWLKKEETKNFHEQFALNRKLVYQRSYLKKYFVIVFCVDPVLAEISKMLVLTFL